MSKDLKDFQDLISAGKKPIFVYFGAKWCNPCRSFTPVFEKLGKENQAKATFIKVDADNGHDIMIAYNVSKIPSLKMFANGEFVEELTGVDETRFKRLLTKHHVI
jgi:thioredoxin